MPFKSKAEERRYFQSYTKKNKVKEKRAEYMKPYMRKYRKEK